MKDTVSVVTANIDVGCGGGGDDDGGGANGCGDLS